jgi:hypothetical protein
MHAVFKARTHLNGFLKILTGTLLHILLVRALHLVVGSVSTESSVQEQRMSALSKHYGGRWHSYKLKTSDTHRLGPSSEICRASALLNQDPREQCTSHYYY